jgi:hypothetical protein
MSTSVCGSGRLDHSSREPCSSAVHATNASTTAAEPARQRFVRLVHDIRLSGIKVFRAPRGQDSMHALKRPRHPGQPA